jgi:hypothetical protein
MIVGYIYPFFMGVLMERRILLLCGLAVGAFLLVFVFSSRYFGLWHSDAAPSTRVAAKPAETMVTLAGEPASAAIAPPPPEPSSAPDVEIREGEDGNTPARRDDRAEHSARTR